VARLAWNESFALGVPEIDRQHQKLFELLAEFDAGAARGLAAQGVRRLFLELSSYSRYHFSSEENLMRARGWAGLEEHAALHREFIVWLEKTAPRLAAGGAPVAPETRRFLSAWLVRHVAVADRLVWADMRQRGLV
jgi:hemerythrin-like metal-binding protein